VADVALISAVPRKIYVALGSGEGIRRREGGNSCRKRSTFNVQLPTQKLECRRVRQRTRLRNLRSQAAALRQQLHRESISPNKIAPSGFPREKAKPADVVASASNPSRCRYTAVRTSHGFARTKHPDSCSARNCAIAEDCAEFSSFICKLIRSDHAGPTVLEPCEDEERGVC